MLPLGVCHSLITNLGQDGALSLALSAICYGTVDVTGCTTHHPSLDLSDKQVERVQVMHVCMKKASAAMLNGCDHKWAPMSRHFLYIKGP